MLVPGGLPRLAAVLSSGLLAACASLSTMFPSGQSIEVSEVRQLVSCNSDGPQARLYLLADREAVRAWQREHKVDLVGVDPLPAAGAYALVEMGVRMSGGYGLFRPGGRLPAHIHDFDESICIVDGSATCVVEGRKYTMDRYSTALQPRGRVHYFVNETDRPMVMVWVYAGPQPERIVGAERNATMEGTPWR